MDNKNSISQIESLATFVIHTRPSRRKAKSLALYEILSLLQDIGGFSARGGPLSESRGVAWINLPEKNVSIACNRLKRLGYIKAVDLVQLIASQHRIKKAPVIKWKKRKVALVRVYEEDKKQFRDDAPDRRTFMLKCGDGIVRPITGYRGGSGPFGHRALPVEDARLLVNLVYKPLKGIFLDPFAGAGGIVIEARRSNWTTLSLDNDPSLRYGLRQLADFHILGSAINLPFGSSSIDAIASEPPYHPMALGIVLDSIHEMVRVLKPTGRAALLVARDHVQQINLIIEQSEVRFEFDQPVNRKGTQVNCLCFTK